MKVCTCLLLLRIFAYTNSSALNTPKEDNEGTNLALNVVLKFDVKENSRNDLYVATNETVIDENDISGPYFRAPRVETFTSFIQEVAKVLNTYEDTALADFFDILDKEIRKYHYKGCKFYELTENYEFRTLVAENLDLIKRKSIPVLKADINEVVAIIRHETYDKNVKVLVDYINSLCREDVREKFRKVLSELKAYGNSISERPKNDLVKIIRDGVRAIVFNHYTDLKINVRRELKTEIAKFLKNIKESPSPSSQPNLFPYRTERRPENAVKIYGYNIAIEDGNTENYSKIDPTSFAKDNDIFILKTMNEKHREEATTLDTSKEESSNIQQLQLTNLSTDESSDETIEGNSIELSPERQQKFNSQTYAALNTEEMFSKTTEQPAILYKSELKSRLVQRMLVEESTDILQTTTPGLRHGTTLNEDTLAKPVILRQAIPTLTNTRDVSDKDLRRSIAPPLPEEELSIDVFDRDERKRQKSLSKSNSIDAIKFGIKDYIKRMRKLQKRVNQLKKIDEHNQNSRMNVTSNGDSIKKKQKQKTRKKKNKRAKNKKRKNKRKESKKIKKTKHISERESYEHEANTQTEKSKNKVTETKGDVKNTNSVKEDVQDLENNKETVKNNVRHAHKLKKQKKATIRKSTKATKPTKTHKKYKGSTDAVRSVNIRVRRSVEPLATAKSNAGNTTVNDNHKKVSKTTLNVTEAVKQKIINNTAHDEYVTKDNPTRRYRRVLEFSSPPLYDQRFDEKEFIA